METGTRRGGMVVVGSEFCAAQEEVLHLWQPPCSPVTHVTRRQGEADGQHLFDICEPTCVCFPHAAHNLQLLHHHDRPVLFTNRKHWSLKKVINVYRGEWRSGNEASLLLFTVKLTRLLQCATNLDVFLAMPRNYPPLKDGKHRAPDYKVRASCFTNSLTIMRNDGAIVAKAKQEFSFSCCLCSKPNYKITMYPGADQAFVSILVAIQANIRSESQGNGGGD